MDRIAQTLADAARRIVEQVNLRRQIVFENKSSLIDRLILEHRPLTDLQLKKEVGAFHREPVISKSFSIP
ncbi:MAG: hypothetical protein FJX59_19800 [Alphaproteobacteria bacterium]|nr:hypothetical protein [Alphaproteobacteria bacterium]